MPELNGINSEHNTLRTANCHAVHFSSVAAMWTGLKWECACVFSVKRTKWCRGYETPSTLSSLKQCDEELLSWKLRSPSKP